MTILISSHRRDQIIGSHRKETPEESPVTASAVQIIGKGNNENEASGIDNKVALIARPKSREITKAIKAGNVKGILQAINDGAVINEEEKALLGKKIAYLNAKYDRVYEALEKRFQELLKENDHEKMVAHNAKMSETINELLERIESLQAIKRYGKIVPLKESVSK